VGNSTSVVRLVGERGSSDTFDSISNQEVVNNQLLTEAVLNSSPPRPSNSKLHVQETNGIVTGLMIAYIL
jgi:hypothetical protein